MAVYKIPNQEGRVRQLNLNDTAGELWATRNIDIHTNPGKIKLARPFKQVATDSDVGGDDVEAFAILGANAYALTSGGLFRDSSPFDDWNSIASAVNNGSKRDMVVFKGVLAISTSNNIDSFNGTTKTSSWWTARGNPSLTDGYPHILEVLRIGAETLAVTDKNKVHAYTGGIAADPILSTTVELDAQFVATCLKSAIRNVWIGTYTEDAEQAHVFEWDGASTNYTESYPVGAKAVLAMEIIDNIPLIITERGDIKIFNNAGFQTVAQFPFSKDPVFANGVETGLIQPDNLARPVHPKGMRRKGNTVFIYANFEDLLATDYGLKKRTPSGVWALDLTTWSLTHLGSQGNESLFATSTPLMVINESSGRIFMGGRTEESLNGIWIEDLDDTSENYGYAVTSEVEADGIQEVFNETITKALLGADDDIVLKYRSRNDVLLPLVLPNCFWASATQFNTAEDLSYIKTRFDLGERDEIEVLLGQGSGRLAHITEIVENSGSYEVTIDEEIGVAPEESTIRFDNFKKVPKAMTAEDLEVLRLGVGDNSSWAQYKLALHGKAGNPTIRSFTMTTNTKEKAK